eukprot:7384423-Prymnesium_polylepis.2
MDSASRQPVGVDTPDAWTVSPRTTTRSPGRVCGCSSSSNSLPGTWVPSTSPHFIPSRMYHLGSRAVPLLTNERNSVPCSRARVCGISRSHGSMARLCFSGVLCTGM